MKLSKSVQSQILSALLLILLSIFFYTLHYVLFHDAHHIFLYLVGDVAFVFIEVLLVTLIIHKVLQEREKRSILKKLNMVIGAFFSEVGGPLLKALTTFDTKLDTLAQALQVNVRCTTQDFQTMRQVLAQHSYQVDAGRGALTHLDHLLSDKRDFMVRLLENPTLLEHDQFTELLWAVFHLTEELAHRPDYSQLPDNDLVHLSGDIKRAYQILVRQWLDYLEHLKQDYPYLFSLALRTNPFDSNASVIIE